MIIIVKTTTMIININSSFDADEVLMTLNETTVTKFLPLFIIIGFLMIFGLIGNLIVLVFIWPKAKQCLSGFFIQILAIVDILVCLTISLAIYNYSTIYIFKSNVVCKIYVFSKFCTALFSGFVLLTVAAYRFRKICCPLKKQLGSKGARITVICGVFLVLLVSSPQLFLMETVNMAVPNKYNITVLGSDCVTKALENKMLQTFATFLDGFYLICFIISSTALIVLYSLQAKAIFVMKKNRVKLQPHLSLSKSVPETNTTGSGDTSCDTNPNNHSKISILACKTSTVQKDGMSQSHNTKNNTNERGQPDQIRMMKLTMMFFVISLGFIFTFLPYISYALWRTFHANKSDVLFTTSVVHLLCLNSYIINSVINPVIYAFFHVKFRQFLCRFLFRCRKKECQI